MRIDLVEPEESLRMQARFAGALTERGLRRGDRIAVELPNSPELLALMLGALKIGVIPVPVDPRLTERERREIVADAEPVMVVDEVLARGLLDGSTRPVDLAEFPLGRPMHYTSGTTGRPKGVWTGVLDEEAARALVAEEIEVWDLSASDRLLICSPMYHSAPIRFATAVLAVGGSVVVMERFEAGSVADVLVRFRPTVVFMVPTHLRRLMALGRLDASSLRRLAHAGAPCPEELKRECLSVFPAGSVWEFYGSTEGQFTVCSPDEWVERPGTVGRARPGRRISIDRDGLVWCEVPEYARWSYWRAPKETARAWDGAAFTVGDLGHIDGDGYLWLDCRREDLIISGGVNVYPAEVERVIRGIEGVSEVAVFGVPDPEWGQRVCAAVVGERRIGELDAIARSLLAPAKRPRTWLTLDELPRTSTGKVKRSELALMVADRGGPTASVERMSTESLDGSRLTARPSGRTTGVFR
ncbi:MAG: acyl-CoA synthetase [Acidimicrobiales bacterium]|nr:MAG: acyl-CoA synthetase [Acidimicrobiales bacterium]